MRGVEVRQLNSERLSLLIQDFPELGAQTYDFVKFSRKLHEIERIWTPRGARIPHAPLKTATGITNYRSGTVNSK